jgi:hypothetical protein
METSVYQHQSLIYEFYLCMRYARGEVGGGSILCTFQGFCNIAARLDMRLERSDTYLENNNFIHVHETCTRS